MQRSSTDGQILSRHPIHVHPDFQAQVTSERLEYRVDGLRVVGFLVKAAPMSKTSSPSPGWPTPCRRRIPARR